MFVSVLALFGLIAAFLPTTVGAGVHIHGRDLNQPLLDSYDYIVVGCGISGLVVSNRLSEISDRTVLCIEAGQPDHYESIIQDPVYVGADIGGIYDWDLSTVPQTQLDGATRPMPQGKVLGGGSILNAMCWNRGGADDYDAWEALGNPGWGWGGILPYFIKSETYTPVYSEAVAQEYSINYNPAVHGRDGPVQVSYPKYFYPQSVNLFAAMNLLGLPTQFDPNDGTSAGPAFVPTDIDPNNQTRSDARRTYYDPYIDRNNFHVITGQHVTRILIEGVANNSEVSNPTAGGDNNGNGASSGSNEGFGFGPGGSTPPIQGQTAPGIAKRQQPANSNHRITGVEFASNASAPRQVVYATREVIVAAGALHSAQLFQLSGIGPASLLEQYDIPLALDLPGVGNNLQDHCLVGTFYPYNNASYPSPTELTTNATYNAEAEQEYNTEKIGPWTAGSPNALAFNPLPLISNDSDSILSNASSQDPAAYLIGGLDPTIVAGFAAQKQSLVQRLGQNHVASYEIINNNAGSLTVSVMHPLSRGTCHITSADPFEPPAIDPRWLTNPTDREVLIEALRFNRQILATPPMLELQPAQFVPPTNADDDALSQVIDNGIRTEFHPSGTLAMLPLELGGVVDSHLRVWGTQNLRVVDAGIFPIIPAAHLQAVVYGVAEKAADIIKADNLPSSAIPTSSSSTAISTSANVSSTAHVLYPNSSTVALSVTSSSASQNTTRTFALAVSSPTSAITEDTLPSAIDSAILALSKSSVSVARTDINSPLTSSAIVQFASVINSVSNRYTIATELAGAEPMSATLGVSEPFGGVLAASKSIPDSVGGSPIAASSSDLLSSTASIDDEAGLSVSPTSILSTPSVSYHALSLTALSSPAAVSGLGSRAASETVLVFTTTLPTRLPNILSSIQTAFKPQPHSASKPRQPVSAQTTVSAVQSSPSEGAAAEAEGSLVGALTSAGIPPSAAESLGAIILGSSSEDGQQGGDNSIDQNQRVAAIEAVMHWLVSFFQQ